tara:strand:+ start:5719 stop:6873 length:1155 start_codon:yes stop_codon:yes gene_type:complete
MKVAQVHNSYLQLTGDDAVVREEQLLLEDNGHSVISFFKSNSVLQEASVIQKIKYGLALKSSKGVGKEFSSFLQKEQPNVVHVHNIFPLITPVIFEVCYQHKIPVVQTLHNYRLLCINTLFYRDGHTCEDCLTHSFSEGIKNRCYNGSATQSKLMARALEYHREKNTWNRYVDRFICLSDFAKSKFIQGGIEEKKLLVKPNFVRDPKATPSYENYWLYAGKLENQKGLDDFLNLAKQTPHVNYKVAGYCENEGVFSSFANVNYMGQLKREELMSHMEGCVGVLFLSKMYEGMPMTILEAFAHKKMVIARNQGAMRDMITHGENGLLYDNMRELREHVVQFQESGEYKTLGQEAYKAYKAKYSEKLAYENLMSIYREVIMANGEK